MPRTTTLKLTAAEVALLYAIVEEFDTVSVYPGVKRIHRQILAKVTAALIATQKDGGL